ncbi:MAG: hypothetical protein ACI86M_003393, partial [Saprospiraceae bacterium]
NAEEGKKIKQKNVTLLLIHSLLWQMGRNAWRTNSRLCQHIRKTQRAQSI